MYRQSEKKLVKQQYLLYMSPQYGELGPLAAEILSLVWGTPANFNGFRVLAALLHGTLVVRVSQTAALNRGRHLYSAGWPSRWTLAHISSLEHKLINEAVCHNSNQNRKLCDGAQMAIFGDFFASHICSEPRAAHFRHAF